MDFGIPIANGASIAVLVLVLGAMFKLIANGNRRERQHAIDIEIMDYRLEAEELKNLHCQKNFLALAGACARAGMEVDPELWAPAPSPTRRDPRFSETYTARGRKDHDS